MRRKFHRQGSVFHVMPRSQIGKELEEVSKILDAKPEILEAVLADITGSCRSDHGREGMTAEQVLRSAILKQSQQLTYEELEFHLGDSQAFRAFARLNVNQFPAHSALQQNIASLRESTWEAIHRVLLGHAREEGIEDGRTARIDTTVVEANIHAPTDSSLLVDGVRVLTRYLLQGKELGTTQKTDHPVPRRSTKGGGMTGAERQPPTSSATRPATRDSPLARTDSLVLGRSGPRLKT